MRINLFKIIGNFKPTLLVLLIALTGVQTLNASGVGRAQTQPTRKAELATATEAERILASLGTEDFSKVRDPKVRLETRKALGILKAIAANTSTAREAGLMAQLDRNFKALKALPQPAGLSFQGCDATYDACIRLCREGAGSCKLCNLGIQGCYVLQFAAAIGKTY